MLEIILMLPSVQNTINTVNAQYLPNAKAYEIQTWYTDRVRRPVSPTNAMTSNIKGQGRKVTSSAWQVLADKSTERNIPETPKLLGRLPTPRAMTRTSLKVNGQWSKSPSRLMLRAEVRHSFRMERPTNF